MPNLPDDFITSKSTSHKKRHIRHARDDSYDDEDSELLTESDEILKRSNNRRFRRHNKKLQPSNELNDDSLID